MSNIFITNIRIDRTERCFNMLKLIWLMLKEEVRLHTSFTHKLEFLLFPVLNFFFVLVSCLLSDRLTRRLDLEFFYYLMNSGLFLYGIFMGAFVFFGSDYVERQFGKVSFIISTPLHHPISFKKIYLAFLLHDILFYFLFTIIPISAALLIATPIMGFHLSSVGLVILCGTLSFVFGISLSFFTANVYSRSVHVFFVFCCTIIASILLLVIGPGYQYIFPAYQFQTTKEWLWLATSLALPILLIVLSELIIPEKPISRDVSLRPKDKFDSRKYRIFKNYSTLVAKEMLDVKRSKMLSKILFSFCVPLIMISFGSYILRTGLDIVMDFNLVFYGSLVGFFGIMIYSFLNFTDNLDCYESLPVSVPQVIKAKLIVFVILTMGVSTVFLVAMAIIMGELSLKPPFVGLFPLAYVVMIITSFYMVITTAYLTGLRTNSYLFNTTTLIKFNVMAILPLSMVTLTSFVIGTNYVVATLTILAICMILVIVTFIFYKKIDKKWGNESFSL